MVSTVEPETIKEQSHHEHPPQLQHHFDTPKQQFESGKLGMWIFLATEILFFGGLFVAYAVYRASHPEIFQYAHQYLDKVLGGINTVVLICSSLTMAWAVRCAQLNQYNRLIAMLIVTLICAFGFLGIKYVEYEHKWKHGLLMGYHYNPDHSEHGSEGHTTEGNHEESTQQEEAISLSEKEVNTEEKSSIPDAAVGPTGLAKTEKDSHSISEPRNVHIFFGIYFCMTGLHGIHVLGGIGVITWLLIGAFQRKYNADYFTPVDLVGLYWHLVDLIWIYLFPLLYLIH
jgi:cytochrome c oxidase subunit 3